VQGKTSVSKTLKVNIDKMLEILGLTLA